MKNLVDLRKQILALRKKQSPANRTRLSQEITNRFLKFFEYAAAPALNSQPQRVALYQSMPDEVDLTPLRDFFEQKGWEVFYPRVISFQGGLFEMVQVHPKTTWKKSSLGILEPQEGAVLTSPDLLDWILVPGVAFGPQGERMGMGAGFYDRFLIQVQRAIRVSLAFDFQCCENLPQNPWDQRVHWILSEKKEFRMRSFPS